MSTVTAPPAPSILIVEDEAIVAADLSERLCALGYRCIGPAASGTEALRLARASQPTLALMDIHIRGNLDGIAVATRLREELEIPVIFLTAHADRATLDRAREAESFGYLLKPFDERILQITIDMAIYKHRMEQERRRIRAELESARAELSTLRGLLSTCCKCNRIQDDTGYWMRMERYISERSEAVFSHTFCPICEVAFYKEAGLPVPEATIKEHARKRFDP